MELIASCRSVELDLSIQTCHKLLKTRSNRGHVSLV